MSEKLDPVLLKSFGVPSELWDLMDGEYKHNAERVE